MTPAVAAARAAAVTPLRTPHDAPLSVLLQRLSNLCLRVRLHHACLHAPVLVDSVRAHVLAPLQAHVLHPAATPHASQTCTTRDAEPHAFAAEFHETARVVHALLLACLPDPPARPHFLPLARVCDAVLAALTARDPGSHAWVALHALWADLVDVLARQVDLWLGQTLQPELLRGFFIDATTDPPTVVESALPAFVPRDVAQMILFAGTAAKCSHILTADAGQSDNILTSMATPRAAAALAMPRQDVKPLRLSADDAFDRVRRRPLAAQLVLQAAASQWRHAAASHLSCLLPFSDIAARLQHLRDYLLHANGQFWHLFFERLRATPLALPTGSGSGTSVGTSGTGVDDNENDETTTTTQSPPLLSPQQRADAERALNHLLASVAADLHHAVDASVPPDAPFALVVDARAALAPRFALSFHETPVLASRAAVYCDLFALTFAVRRAVSETRAAWAHLRELHRGGRVVVANDDGGTLGVSSSPRARRRAAARALVRPLEIRRRMGVFLDAFEWYVQAEVIEPKFMQLRARLDAQMRAGDSEFFDAFTTLHERAVDAVVRQCFVADAVVQTRVSAILAACVAFADAVRGVDDATDARGDAVLRRAVDVVGAEFERQAELLVQMLMHARRGGGESRVHALLLRLNANGYEAF